MPKQIFCQKFYVEERITNQILHIKKIYQDYSFSAELPRILNQSTATNIRRSFILTKKVFKGLGEYIVAFPQGHDPINPGSVHTSEL